MMLQALTMQHNGRWKNAPAEYAQAYIGAPNLKGGWEIRKFAGPLKQFAALLLGVDRSRFEDEEYKSSLLGPEWDRHSVTAYNEDEGCETTEYFIDRQSAIEYVKGWWEDYEEGVTTDDEVYDEMIGYEQYTVRDFLCTLATTAIRDKVHPNAFINGTLAGYIPEANNWIITDLRFMNEVKTLKEKKAILIRVNNPRIESNENYIEKQLDKYEGFDYLINNDGTIEELEEKVMKVFDFIKQEHTICYS